jgi:hypothetical protein
MNICYGEYVELERWISNSIVPLFLLLLIFFIILYVSTDLISKEIISLMNILLIIITIVIIALGIFTFYKVTTVKISNIAASWEILSKQSKIYYYDNKIEVLYDIYRYKMITTGICFIVLSLISIINISFSFLFLDKLGFYWRPPLIARLNDERALRYIEYFKKFSQENKDDLNLDKEKEKLLPENARIEQVKQNKIEGIIDLVNTGNNTQLQSSNIKIKNEGNLNSNVNQNMNENDFDLDPIKNNDKKDDKNYLSNLRRKNKEPQK